MMIFVNCWWVLVGSTQVRSGAPQTLSIELILSMSQPLPPRLCYPAHQKTKIRFSVATVSHPNAIQVKLWWQQLGCVHWMLSNKWFPNLKCFITSDGLRHLNFVLQCHKVWALSVHHLPLNDDFYELLMVLVGPTWGRDGAPQTFTVELTLYMPELSPPRLCFPARKQSLGFECPQRAIQQKSKVKLWWFRLGLALWALEHPQHQC